MMYHGEKKYSENAKLIIDAVQKVAEFVRGESFLTLLGDP